MAVMVSVPKGRMWWLVTLAVQPRAASASVAAKAGERGLFLRRRGAAQGTGRAGYRESDFPGQEMPVLWLTAGRRLPLCALS